jgi:hypothetical protein
MMFLDYRAVRGVGFEDYGLLGQHSGIENGQELVEGAFFHIVITERWVQKECPGV